MTSLLTNLRLAIIAGLAVFGQPSAWAASGAADATPPLSAEETRKLNDARDRVADCPPVREAESAERLARKAYIEAKRSGAAPQVTAAKKALDEANDAWIKTRRTAIAGIDPAAVKLDERSVALARKARETHARAQEEAKKERAGRAVEGGSTAKKPMRAFAAST